MPTDFWLNTYWLLLCGMLIYLLGYGSRALLILRSDPRSRHGRQHLPVRVGDAASLACVVRIVTALVPPLQTVQGSALVWVFACAVRRRLRADLGVFLADQDQVVHPRKQLSTRDREDFSTVGVRRLSE